MLRSSPAVTALAVALLVSAVVGLAPLITHEGSSTQFPGQYTIMFEDEAREAIDAIWAQIPEQFQHHKFQVFPGLTTKHLPAALLEVIRQHPMVRYVEEATPVYPSTVRDENALQGLFGHIWGLDRIDGATDMQYDDHNLDGQGTNNGDPQAHVYVIDTGINPTHQEFAPPGRATADFDAYQGTADSTNGIDVEGHGTHCAGTIGGVTTGVSKDARIHGIRVLKPGGASNTDVIAGMDYVAANHIKPAVASMSLGGPGNTASDEGAARLVAAGVVTLVAAGNDGNRVCNAIALLSSSPARAPEVLTVAATEPTSAGGAGDQQAYYSNWGACVDIYAPGGGDTPPANDLNQAGGNTGDIESAWEGASNVYAAIRGTSMATPHVAGVAAAYVAAVPHASPQQTMAALLSAGRLGYVTSTLTDTPNVFLQNTWDTTFNRDPASAGHVVVAEGDTASGTLTDWSHAYFKIPVRGFRASTTVRLHLTPTQTDVPMRVYVGNTPRDFYNADLAGQTASWSDFTGVSDVELTATGNGDVFFSVGPVFDTYPHRDTNTADTDYTVQVEVTRVSRGGLGGLGVPRWIVIGGGVMLGVVVLGLGGAAAVFLMGTGGAASAGASYSQPPPSKPLPVAYSNEPVKYTGEAPKSPRSKSPHRHKSPRREKSPRRDNFY